MVLAVLFFALAAEFFTELVVSLEFAEFLLEAVAFSLECEDFCLEFALLVFFLSKQGVGRMLVGEFPSLFSFKFSYLAGETVMSSASVCQLVGQFHILSAYLVDFVKFVPEKLLGVPKLVVQSFFFAVQAVLPCQFSNLRLLQT